jgi:Zinc knuckle
MRLKRDMLLTHGGEIEDHDFASLILESLPIEYRTIVSTLSNGEFLTVPEVEKALEREEAILKANRTESRPARDMALVSTASRKLSGGRASARGSGGKTKARCFRCGKPGHFKRVCRVPEERLPGAPQAAESTALVAGASAGSDYSLRLSRISERRILGLSVSGSSRHLSWNKD